jgi:hypothetical protein
MVVAATVVTATGCMAENQRGCCEPPKEKLEWFFIEEQGPPWVGSNHWYVACYASIEDAELQEWIKAKAGEDVLN